jgi:SHS2 domain-containing protein
MRSDGAGGAGRRTAPHTADLLLEAWAPSRARCLEEAALGLVETFARPRAGAPTRRRALHRSADGDEELLLAVLEEVVYVVDAWGEVPVAVGISVDGKGVDGWLEVVELGDVEVVGPVPKGVSRHELALTESDGTWTGRAVVDV